MNTAVSDAIRSVRVTDSGVREIFDEIKTKGPAIISADDGFSCVIMPTDYYMKILDEFADRELEAVAAERLKKYELYPQRTIDQAEIDREFGFTEQDLVGWKEVEFE